MIGVYILAVTCAVGTLSAVIAVTLDAFVSFYDSQAASRDRLGRLGEDR